ncbi:hypothetical protein [Nocardia testacea]|uniref:DUF5753 domain-containing protein n=1 Tax=Nocardia testacea TaxID=248551 RepID=A0ABW7W5Y0_9NOCA
MALDSVPALAYLRTDLCGRSRQLVEQRMCRLSARLGYELRETIRTDATNPARLVLLEDRIGLHRAEAVFIPAAAHLDGQLGRIVAQADVIEQDGQTHARWSPIAYSLDATFVSRLAQLWIDRRCNDRSSDTNGELR